MFYANYPKIYLIFFSSIVWPLQGDSGGPLVYNGTLIGIVTFGSAECGYGFPDVFANIVYLYDWIKIHTNL